jgi:hypothetical protein
MDQQQRDIFLERTKAHYAADMLMSGLYADERKGTFVGCSVGCLLHDAHPQMTTEQIEEIEEKHAAVADAYGYPEWLAHLQDAVFEGLPAGERENWHVQLAEALHSTGDDYDWQAALHRVHAAILRISYRTAGGAGEAVKTVLDLHERAGRGEDVSDDMWSAAEAVATSAAWSAATSAAWSAAWSAYQEIRDAVLSALTITE